MNLKKFLRKRNVIFLSIVVVVVIGVAIIATLPAGASSTDLSAKLSEEVGVVEVSNGAQAAFNPVNNGFLLKAIMQLQTKEQSKVRLDLTTGTIVRIGQTTIFSLDSQQAVSGGVLQKIKLQVGRLFVILKGGTLDVTTPGGLASVRGSYLSVWVEAATGTTAVSCLEGSCGYQNAAGDVDLTSGQKVVSTNTNILPPVEKMDQTDIQAWLDNVPESVAIIPQIQNLVATSTSTPTLTPTLTGGTVTDTPTVTPTPILTNLAGSGIPVTGQGTPSSTLQFTLTPTRSFGTITVTPTLRNSPTGFLSATPFASATARATFAPTATLSVPPSSTPVGVPTSPAPSNTPLPAPSNTPLPAPSNTPRPLPSNTPVPPPTNTPVPPPTNTPVPYP